MALLTLSVGVLVIALSALLLHAPHVVVWRESQGPTIETLHMEEVPALCDAFRQGRVRITGSTLPDAPTGAIFTTSTALRGLTITRSSTRDVTLSVPSATGPARLVELRVPLEEGTPRPSFSASLDESGLVRFSSAGVEHRTRYDKATLDCDRVTLHGSHASPNQVTVTASAPTDQRPSKVVVATLCTATAILMVIAMAGTRRERADDG